MLIEIVFVRYRGLCDILIYTIGFMHDDFFSVLHDSANKMDGGDNDTKLNQTTFEYLLTFVLRININI